MNRARVILASMEAWECRLIRLGLVPYEQAWEYQRSLAGEIATGEQPPSLLLCEHPHTYTFGRRGQAANLLWDGDELRRRGVSVHWVDRGGDVTYHGPGQLVGYPLLRLGKPTAQTARSDGSNAVGEMRIPQADYLGYIRQLEECLILALMKLGLAGGQMEGKTGVWIQPEVLSRCRACPPQLRQQPAKIASIGVKVDARGISSHGFALNVDPDMSYWEGIVACGLQGYRATSLGELLEPAPDTQATERAVCEAFEQVFGCRLVETGMERARLMSE